MAYCHWFRFVFSVILISTIDCRRPLSGNCIRKQNEYSPKSFEGNLKWTDNAPPPREVSVRRGESVEFRCTARGDPCPKYTFFKNGIGKFSLL